MSGNSIGEPNPATIGERVISLIFMLFGAGFYGKIFGDLVFIFKLQ